MGTWVRACGGLIAVLSVLSGGAAASQEPVMCRGRTATIVGSEGPDTLVGTGGDDVIAGLGGDDTIQGSDGNDTICGGDGGDRIYGQDGDDVIDLGETGAEDRAEGGPGDDRFIPTDSGLNVIAGGLGAADLVSFTAFDGDVDGLYIDLKYGTFAGRQFSPTEGLISGIERAVGGPFDDLIRGSRRPNKLVGEAGDDLLDGRGGSDVLRGRHGRDRAMGGSGLDDCRAEVRRSCER